MPGVMHMKIREIMTPTVIQIHSEETVAAAARTLARYNIGGSSAPRKSLANK